MKDNETKRNNTSTYGVKAKKKGVATFKKLLGAKTFKEIVRDISNITCEADREEVARTIGISATYNTISTKDECLCFDILNAMLWYHENELKEDLKELTK